MTTETATLRRIEGKLARLQGIVAVLVLALAALVAREITGRASADPEAGGVAQRIAAREFVVLDERGRVALSLRPSALGSGEIVINGYESDLSLIEEIVISGAGISFRSRIIDPEIDMSRILLTIGADKNGGVVSTYNTREKLSVGLATDGEGNGRLVVADRDGRARIAAEGGGAGPLTLRADPSPLTFRTLP